MTKCSIVMMSWVRPENLNKIIETYDGYDVVGEIIVWNNNKHLFASDLGLNKVKVLNCSADFGLDSRFVGSMLAKNRCIIVHDDDLILSEKNIKNLVRNFEMDHTRIYTYEGRIPQGGAYTCAPGPGRVEDVSEPTEVPISLTRCACFDRLYAAEYAKLSDTMFYDVYTNLNGEDIVFSYLTSHLSGKMPMVLPVLDKDGYVELPSSQEEKISTRNNFTERRTELIKRCEIILPLPKYPPSCPNKFVFFGAGNYPFAYFDESFNINSKFKKMLVKESNGIKYLSLDISSYTHAVSTIKCDLEIGPNDVLNLGMFYKGYSIFTEISIFAELNGKGKESKRISVDVKENVPNNISIRATDFFEDINSLVLKRIDFISYNPDKSENVLCISEISLIK
jgi:hypothetical protein